MATGVRWRTPGHAAGPGRRGRGCRGGRPAGRRPAGHCTSARRPGRPAATGEAVDRRSGAGRATAECPRSLGQRR
ncbi:hypothetical protein C1N81_00530 (plasmid) [Streptomyces sp. SGAir0957]